MNNTYTQSEQIKYSKLLSSLFCSISIVALSILCLLNNLSLDFYTMIVILKVVLPASFCFWFIGYIIGKILDSYSKEITIKQVKNEQAAYEMTSMFAGGAVADDEFGDLV